MKFICLVYNDEKRLEQLSERELAAFVVECGACIGELERGGHHVASSGLQSISTATTVRNRNGHMSITDGPFAETKEQLGGFTIIEARDLNEALRLAGRLPSARYGSIEVRPLFDPQTPMNDPLDRRFGAAIRFKYRSKPEGERL